MNKWFRFAIPVFALAAFLSQPVFAQMHHFTKLGQTANDQFGWSVGNAGDFNNDGKDDVIIGARWYDPGSGTSKNFGKFYVYSGADGSLIFSEQGAIAYDRLGSAVDGAGDVDADGFDDVIVGAEGVGTGFRGAAYIYSGRTHAKLYSFDTNITADSYFGGAAAGAGDVNNDGFADVIIGAQQEDLNGINSGMARVFSGKTGAILHTFVGNAADDYFGFSVAGAGDVNGDGFDDLIAGAPYGDPNGQSAGGYAKILSGKTGTLLAQVNGLAGDDLGYSVSGAGDVNGDGWADVIVGAPYADVTASESGKAIIYSGGLQLGQPLQIISGDSATDLFGAAVAGAGDVNGDGHDDVVIGALWDDFNFLINSGSARVVSGKNGSTLGILGGSTFQIQWGLAVAGGGDVNADGLSDLIVASFLDDTNGGDAGKISVFLGRPSQAISTVGQGCKTGGITTVPTISASGSPTAGSTLTFNFTSSTTSVISANFLGGHGSQTPSLLFGCPVYPDRPGVVRKNLPIQASTQTTFKIPASTPPGTVLLFQFLSIIKQSPTSQTHVATSQAIQVITQ